MDLEAGDVVKRKDSDQKMTVLRFVGGDENDAMNMMDHQLSSKGFQSGSPMCEWFVGATIKTGTFHLRDIQKVEDEPIVEESEEEILEDDDQEELEAESTEEEKESEEDEEDFNFDDEDFDF